MSRRIFMRIANWYLYTLRGYHPYEVGFGWEPVKEQTPWEVFGRW